MGLGARATKTCCLVRVLSIFGERVVTADGFAARRGWTTGGIDSTPATRRQRGMVLRGALRGESPRTREGRRPDRTELQWLVVSDQ